MFMQAEFEMKPRVIRSKGRTTRLLANVPRAFASLKKKKTLNLVSVC